MYKYGFFQILPKNWSKESKKKKNNQLYLITSYYSKNAYL